MNIFEFENYKSYMKKVLTRGMRTNLAQELGCQIGFISQVLRGDSHFSLEHSLRICRFFSLSEKESNFFMLLVQKAKSGSVDLEQYFEEKIQEQLQLREKVSERVEQTRTLSDRSTAQYFSSAAYALIHMELSLIQEQTIQELVQNSRMDLATVNRVLNFLTENELVTIKDGRYSPGPTRIHLPSDSNHISQHHTNIRVEIIKSLARLRSEDLHYSGVFTMSRKSARKIRKMLVDVIEKSDREIKDSPDENVYIMGLDFLEY